MVQALNTALDQEMAHDDQVVLLGEDIGINGGVFRVTEGLFEKYGGERVMDTPLAESGILGTAIGMSMAGMKPVCEMQFSGFSYVIFAQLEGNASRYRSRTQGRFSCPLVVRMPYGGGVRALEHHSESREATYGHVPGVKVVIPSTPRNARSLLAASIQDPDPVIFMEPKHSYRAFREEVPEEREVTEIGKSEVLIEGGDVTVVSWGSTMRPVLDAVKTLQAERGASIELIDLLTISPMDSQTIIDSVKKTGRCVVVQEAPRTLSVSSEIIARINDSALMFLEAPVNRITHYDIVTPNFGRERKYLPTAARIQKAIIETLEF
jgi:pyruvate dehydrogenase E1 component beta subunit